MQKDSLSLIERGRRFPHPEHFLLLTERYGVAGYSLGDFFDQKTARMLELKNRILSAMQFKELGLLPELLFSFREAMEAKSHASDSGNIFSQQFFQYASGWFGYASGGEPQPFLTACIACLRLTQPHFGEAFNPADTFLNQNELMILNSIACLYALLSQTRQALILFEQLLLRLKEMHGSHPIHFRNLACLTHNAALLEWEYSPIAAEEHLQKSLSLSTQYGGAWQGCLIWRSQLQVKMLLHPQENLTGEFWALEAAFDKFRPANYRPCDFEEFKDKKEYLELF